MTTSQAAETLPEVTPEMEHAGVWALLVERGPSDSWETRVASVYRAMHAARPPTFTPDELEALARIVEAGMWELCGIQHTQAQAQQWERVCCKLRLPGYDELVNLQPLREGDGHG